ncbi:MAG TPA: glycoside hydrolase family 3 N-terminal domain-containing protein [Gemmatimonadales bacterium]|nr:glycoside hydrolase family 3 N-terminal domain-containing protein [Gemmatimonadales bacterium]
MNDLLGRMTREEKFWQLYMSPADPGSRAGLEHGIFGLQLRPAGRDTGAVAARRHAAMINAAQRYFIDSTRLGIPIIPFEETLHGLGVEGATVYPQSIALAASWDPGVMRRVAAAIGEETRNRGIRHALSPVINLATDARWGRTEETYGEDPFLTSLMGAAYVSMMQAAGVIATPKHFVANVGDGGRDSYPIEISRRKLEEGHFPPFRAAIEAGAGSIMTSYNSVDGDPATQSRYLLTETLRRDMGFRGFVISDQAATGGATVLHLTEANTADAALHAWQAGLDVVFQSEVGQAARYYEPVRDGRVPDLLLDHSVRRVLTAKFALGLFEHPYVDLDRAESSSGRREHRDLAREAARLAIVLLHNNGVLPLDSRHGPVAVIGTDAREARLGGYSGTGTRAVSLLEALRQRLGSARVRYAPGPGRYDSAVSVARIGPLRGEYFARADFTGPVQVRNDSVIDFAWVFSPPLPGMTPRWYAVRWTGSFTVPPSGVRRIGVEGNEGYRLYLDDRLVLDTWRRQSAGMKLAEVRLTPGSTHRVRLEFRETLGSARIRLVWDAGMASTWQARIAEAVAATRGSKVAIIAAGIEEGEFRDRASRTLPGHQEELIRAVARTGTPTIVVLYGGSAVVMESWLDSTAAVVDAWYPGEQGGPAVAEVLFGDYNPAGRLPITFPQSEGQLPLVYNHKPTGRGDDYLDRSGAPRFPFGFGLSYTTFGYDSLRLTPGTIGVHDSAVVRLRVTNTGRRAGDEVVQLYVEDELASVAQPVRALKGFERIHLAPGESRAVRFVIGRKELELLDREMRWVVEPGTFRLLVGASSADIRLAERLTVR